ncbi:hypothetical protein NK8_29060 [Caballeronia sp. NK8]|uniref:hypothetical protein n=1 Tax=Caballeronia sp. NK8 TaxID=140098 RepID=UPI001BB5887A|nr:hypothetical protein [Caballeronia sp. NK8]BCQ24730.1 hypothetical protein NK8_29060 [Caballeronia sp. NK8]
MKEILDTVLPNLPLLYVPAVGFLFSLLLLRIKRRYVKEGSFLRRSPVSSSERQLSLPRGRDVTSENQIDLDIALRKIHELALADGDLGYAYWYQVGQLLRRADGMQTEIDSLREELEKCRATRRTKRANSNSR